MRLTKTRNIYLEFLDHLNRARVRYAVLHGWESLDDGDVSDIDIIVASEDVTQLEAWLRETYIVLNVFHYEASSFGFVLAPKQDDLSCAFVADISTDYRWRGRIFFIGQQLLQNRQCWRDYWVIGPAQEFAYLLVKKIYEKGNIPQHQRTRIRQLAERLGSHADAIMSRLFGKPWCIKVRNWIERQEWADLERNVPVLRRRLRSQIFLHDFTNPARYWLGEIKRFWSRWQYPTGLCVAVLGPSGPWRQSMVECLQTTFAKAFRRTVIFERTPPVGILRSLLVRSTLVIFDRYSMPLPGRFWFAKPDLLLGGGPNEPNVQAIRTVSNFLSERYLRRRSTLFSGCARRSIMR